MKRNCQFMVCKLNSPMNLAFDIFDSTHFPLLSTCGFRKHNQKLNIHNRRKWVDEILQIVQKNGSGLGMIILILKPWEVGFANWPTAA